VASLQLPTVLLCLAVGLTKIGPLLGQFPSPGRCPTPRARAVLVPPQLSCSCVWWWNGPQPLWHPNNIFSLVLNFVSQLFISTAEEAMREVWESKGNMSKGREKDISNSSIVTRASKTS